MQFTPEEMKSLGMSPGDKFEVDVSPAGGVLLKKMPSLEIDLHSLGVDTLAALVAMSIEEQKPVDEVIVDLLSGYLRGRPSKSVE